MEILQITSEKIKMAEIRDYFQYAMHKCPSYYIAPAPEEGWVPNLYCEWAYEYMWVPIYKENGCWKQRMHLECGSTIFIHHPDLTEDNPTDVALHNALELNNDVYIQYKGKEELEWIGHDLYFYEGGHNSDRDDDSFGGIDVLIHYEVESGYKDAEDSIAKSWTSVYEYKHDALTEFNRLVKGGEYDWVNLYVKGHDEEINSWDNPNPSYED